MKQFIVSLLLFLTIAIFAFPQTHHTPKEKQQATFDSLQAAAKRTIEQLEGDK